MSSRSLAFPGVLLHPECVSFLASCLSLHDGQMAAKTPAFTCIFKMYSHEDEEGVVSASPSLAAVPLVKASSFPEVLRQPPLSFFSQNSVTCHLLLQKMLEG